MNIFSILGIAIVGVIMSVLLKQYLPGYSLLVTLTTSIIILCWVVVNIVPVLDKLTYFINEIKMPNEYSLIILKSLGLAFVVQLISDICRDSGESAIASKLELAGKISILIISLPLFEKIISIIFEMLR